MPLPENFAKSAAALPKPTNAPAGAERAPAGERDQPRRRFNNGPKRDKNVHVHPRGEGKPRGEQRPDRGPRREGGGGGGGDRRRQGHSPR